MFTLLGTPSVFCLSVCLFVCCVADGGTPSTCVRTVTGRSSVCGVSTASLRSSVTLRRPIRRWSPSTGSTCDVHLGSVAPFHSEKWRMFGFQRLPRPFVIKKTTLPLNQSASCSPALSSDQLSGIFSGIWLFGFCLREASDLLTFSMLSLHQSGRGSKTDAIVSQTGNAVVRFRNFLNLEFFCLLRRSDFCVNLSAVTAKMNQSEAPPTCCCHSQVTDRLSKAV